MARLQPQPNYSNWQKTHLEGGDFSVKSREQPPLLHTSLFKCPFHELSRCFDFQSLFWIHQPSDCLIIIIIIIILASFWKIKYLKLYFRLCICTSFEFSENRITLNETSENMNKQWASGVLSNNGAIVRWLNTWEILIVVYWHVG